MVIRAADCIPVLLINIKEGSEKTVIAALHCGWRSVVSDLIGNTIKKIKKILNKENLQFKIILGPGIDFCSYSFQPNGKKQAEKFLKENNLKSEDYFYYDKNQKKERYFFDLKKLIISQFLLYGCCYENIINLAIDTYKNTDYNSYRRDEIKQRNYSIIQKRKDADIKNLLK